MLFVLLPAQSSEVAWQWRRWQGAIADAFLSGCGWELPSDLWSLSGFSVPAVRCTRSHAEHYHSSIAVPADH